MNVHADRRLRLCAMALEASMVGSILIAVALAFFYDVEALFGASNRSVAHAFYQQDQLTEAAVRHQGWLFGIVAAAIVGWAVTIFGILRGPFRRGEPWAWNTLFLGVTSWVVIDIGVSVASGIGGEVIFVVAASSTMLIPLLLYRGSFRSTSV